MPNTTANLSPKPRKAQSMLWLLALLLAATACNALEEALPTDEVVNMLKFYGSSNEHVGADMVPTDSGYLLLGTESLEASRQMVLKHVNQQGEIIWQNNYGDSQASHEVAERIVPALFGGGYLLVGQETTGGIKHILAVRIDVDGNKLWSLELADTNDPNQDHTAGGAVQLSDGTWALCGMVEPVGNGTGPLQLRERDFFVARFGAEGDSVYWANRSGFDNSRDEAVDIAQLDDATLLVFGTTQRQEQGKALENFALGQYGIDDGLARQTDAFGGTASEIGRRMIATREGGYLLVGDRATTSSSSISAIYMVKLFSDARADWEREHLAEGEETRVENALVASGGYMLVGKKNRGTANNQDYGVLLLKVDFSGADQEGWPQVINADQNQVGLSAVEEGTGHWVVMGTNQWDNLSTMFLLRAGPNGLL